MACPDGLTLLVGGARSGKSDLAQRLAAESDVHVVFVATAEAGDDDMAERIERHRRDRPTSWSTIEEPLDLAGVIAAVPPDVTVVIDCLTLWTANVLFGGLSSDDALERSEAAATQCSERGGRTIVVTNEVGSGLHPSTALEREYRDLLGRVNAAWACQADRTWLVVAGQVLPLQRVEELT